MMKATQEQIVQRFRAGQSIPEIAMALGRGRETVRRLIRAVVPSARRRSSTVRKFVSRPDGEYCECRHCAALGYGADAWHPVTSEFWREYGGTLSLGQCKACLSEVEARSRGLKPARFDA